MCLLLPPLLALELYTHLYFLDVDAGLHLILTINGVTEKCAIAAAERAAGQNLSAVSRPK